MSNRDGDVFVFVFFPLLIFVCGLVAVLCARNCSARSIYRYLPGGKEEYDEVTQDIADPELEVGSVIIGKKYMVSAKAFTSARFAIIELSDIAIVYKQVTRTRYYGVITVSKTNALAVHKDMIKHPITYQMRDANVMEILRYFFEEFPTIYVGFDQSLINKWRQNPSKEVLGDYRCEQ